MTFSGKNSVIDETQGLVQNVKTANDLIIHVSPLLTATLSDLNALDLHLSINQPWTFMNPELGILPDFDSSRKYIILKFFQDY